MLASILPGLREFRTPFATGALWLTILWVWFGNKLPETAPDGGLLRRIYVAVQALGPTITLTALAFAAYVLGAALVLRLNDRIADLTVQLARFVTSHFKLSAWTTAASILDSSEDRLAAKIARRLDAEFDTYQMRGQFIRQELGLPLAPVEQDASADTPILAKAIVAKVRSDQIILAMRLRLRDSATHEHYDRMNAESEFRISVAAPIVVLAVSVAFSLAPGLALAIGISLAGVGLGSLLMYRGIALAVGARAVLVHAVTVDLVEAPVLESLTELREKFGPAST